MSKPQQPEIGRSRRTPSQDPDSAAAVLEGSPRLTDEGPGGPVPPENQPGHHPAKEQDKPDLDAFAEKLGATGGTDGGAPAPAARDGGAPLPSAGRAPVLRVAAAVLGTVAVLLLGRMVRGRRAHR